MTEIMEGALRYHSALDLSNENATHTQLVLLSGEGRRVLEVGPAAGYITEALRERGCRVTCVELDAEAAKVAERFAERMIVGDIEHLDFDVTFGDDRFDVVMFGDVLEHLVNPLAVLRKVKGVLSDKGCIVASFPNIAHGSIRLALLRGNFDYTEIGLLDRTHLRHFTRETLEDLFRDAGFGVTTWRRIRIDPFMTEKGLVEDEFPPLLVKSLREDVEAMTYQFALKAVPIERGTGDGQAGEGADRVPDRVLVELWNMENALRKATESLTRTEAERAALKAQLAELENELKVRLGELEGALRRISDIEGSIGWRALNRARPIIRLFAPRGSPQFRILLASARLGWRTLRLGARLFARVLRRVRGGSRSEGR